jgi:hypothetical protein
VVVSSAEECVDGPPLPLVRRNGSRRRDKPRRDSRSGKYAKREHKASDNQLGRLAEFRRHVIVGCRRSLDHDYAMIVQRHPGREALTKDEAHRIAVNLARLHSGRRHSRRAVRAV